MPCSTRDRSDEFRPIDSRQTFGLNGNRRAGDPATLPLMKYLAPASWLSTPQETAAAPGWESEPGACRAIKPGSLTRGRSR